MKKYLVLLILSMPFMANAQCYKKVAAGSFFSFAIKTDNTLWSWGMNDKGQLGVGDTLDHLTPQPVDSIFTCKEIFAGGYHALSIKQDGSLWAWGDNYYGQLGDGSGLKQRNPVQIGTATNWLAISGGTSFSMALKTDGTIWCWGSNPHGQCGQGTISARITTPQQVGTASNWVKIAAGYNSCYAINTLGEMYVWGGNTFGQLGIASLNSNETTPVKMTSDYGWKEISTAGFHVLAIKNSNTLWAWGLNDKSQLGDGTIINSNVPMQVGTNGSWVYATATHNASYGIRSNGSQWAWGGNYFGQVGNGNNTTQSTLLQIAPSNNWSTLSGGQGHALAIDNQQKLWVRGSNRNGELGDGTLVKSNTLLQVACTTPVSTQDINKDNIKLYPNPSSGIIYISGIDKITNIELYDLTGQKQTAISANNNMLDISALSEGHYILRINNGKSITTHRIIKI